MTWPCLVGAFGGYPGSARVPILSPKAPAEKRTNEQPIGKITSFAPKDSASAAVGGGVDPIVRATIVPPKTRPTKSPTATCAAAPPQGRWPTQPTNSPRHPYSTPFMTPTKTGERTSPPPPPVLAIASSVPLCSARETSNAAGAANRPRRPITGTRALATAVPTARPQQTNIDQVTFPTRSATIEPIPKDLPSPAPSRSSRPSMAIPSAIASQATRRSLTPRLGDAAEDRPAGASERASPSVPPVTCFAPFPRRGRGKGRERIPGRSLAEGRSF